MHNFKKIYKKEYFFILFLFIIYIFTINNSVGFYKDDEHFQILEPVAYLLGLNNVLLDHPLGINWEWEINHRIRPWLQPNLYYFFVICLKSININDPFAWVFVIKGFNAILGFISILCIFYSFRKYFDKNNSLFHYYIFFTFWFFPFLHTRTSSESLGIILFCLSFPFLLNFFENKKSLAGKYKIIFLSFILGLSVVVRPQMIFTIFPIFLWLLFFNLDIKKIFICFIGFSLAIILGICIDSLNWGFFTNTYYQLYKVQIAGGFMSTFSIEPKPWWFYISVILLELAPIFSLFFFISFIYFFYKNPKSVFSWLILGTYIILTFFNHKETRFIFPVYIFAPFFLIYIFGKFKNLIVRNILINICVFVNLVFLIIISSFPLNGKVALYKFLYYQKYSYQNIYYYGENPYQMNKLEPFFYTSFLPEIEEGHKYEFKTKSLIITNNYDHQNIILSNISCNNIYSTYPKIILDLNSNWKNKKMNWYVNYCK